MDEIEKDSICELRMQLNTEVLTKEKFIKYQNIFKVLPEIFELAKQNN
jgi:hypothetical protein